MRLIDADALYTEMTKSKSFGELTAKRAIRKVVCAKTVEAIPVKWIEAKRDELANKLAEVAGVLDLEELADAYCHHLKSINNLLDEWEEKNE